MNLASYSSMLFVVELVNSPGVEMLAVPPCSPGGMARCFLQANQETPGRRESPEELPQSKCSCAKRGTVRSLS